MTPETSVLERTRQPFREAARAAGLLDARVSVLGRPLTPEEAIGTPGRRDFPIVLGRERVLEARVRGARGHAFTDDAREFEGTLAEVIELALDTPHRRAIYTATLNAVLTGLGRVDRTVHCRDEDPEHCAREIAETVLERHGRVRVGLVGLNPALAERLAETFGPDRVRITDLDERNRGSVRFGVEIWDGAARNPELIETSDVVILTGTTLVNGTFDDLWARIRRAGKIGIVYGVTAAGVAALAGFERLCPRGRTETDLRLKHR